MSPEGCRTPIVLLTDHLIRIIVKCRIETSQVEAPKLDLRNGTA
jgi:hypothetical protein